MRVIDGSELLRKIQTDRRELSNMSKTDPQRAKIHRAYFYYFERMVLEQKSFDTEDVFVRGFFVGALIQGIVIVIFYKLVG